MQWGEKAWWEMPMWIVVLTPFLLLCRLIFSSAPSSSQIKLNNNHQIKHGRGCGVNLTSYPLPNFSHKEFIDIMGLDQMKWQDIATPPCFYVLQQYWKISRNKPESHCVKTVNTHKGCWYHSWQDNDSSLMLRNQMKWQDITPLPPDSVSHNNNEGHPAIKKDVQQ